MALLAALDAHAQNDTLDASCTLSVLNRTGLVGEDGGWVIPNVPANQGQVRVRATCVDENGVRRGQSSLVAVPSNGIRKVVDIDFSNPTPIPDRLELTAPTTQLGTVGEIVQIVATATYPGGATADVTAQAKGTSYRSSNVAIASVDPAGRVTAHTSGRALVSALNEGAIAVLMVSVLLGQDTDGDGLPDDWELANGLDPNNPLDAADDPDQDGLTSGEEFVAGTSPTNPDSDGDGLRDGDEVRTLGTNPLLGDSDGDGIWDGLEIQTGSNPLDATSFNLAAALLSLEIRPSAIELTFNTAFGETSRRVQVVGRLRDGRELDATSSRYGTVYTSSNLNVASFGAEDGRIFAGTPGRATVTAATAGFSATTLVTVSSFSPQVLSSLILPGTPMAAALDGNQAYVACDDAGLQVVDVANPRAPRIVGHVATGQARDVAVQGSRAYVADALGRLVIVDVTSPTQPVVLGSAPVGFGARGVAVRGAMVFVTDNGGLAIVDATVPQSPFRRSRLSMQSSYGVDLDGSLALVAAGSGGLKVVDVSDVDQPRLVGQTPTRPAGGSLAAAVVARGGRAYVADAAGFALGGLRVVDYTDPTTPAVVGSTGDQFGLRDVTVEAQYALAADVYFVNAVPIFNLAASPPSFDALVDFSAIDDDNGTGIAARNGIVYLTAEGARGGRLYIARYAVLNDAQGIPPTVEITAPTAGATFDGGTVVTVAADATDDFGVARVEFYLDGELLFTDFGAPYGTTIALPPRTRLGGTVRFGAAAFDLAGNQGTANEIIVTTRPNPAPVVRLIAPVDGATAQEDSRLTLSAQATSGRAITKVEFSVDGTLAATDTTTPYRADVTVPAGVSEIAITAVAFDDLGPSTTSPPARVTVLPDDAPVATILAPPDGRQVAPGSIVEVTAGAADDYGVVTVTPYVDGEPRPALTLPPYQFTVTAPSGSGEILLAVEATDTVGHVARSEEIRVVVSEDPLTTVVGAVVTVDADPAAGANVICLGERSATDANGAFIIVDVPTFSGDVQCSATLVDPIGRVTTGEAAAVTPVPGGETDVGLITLAIPEGQLYPGLEIAMNDRPRAVRVVDVDADGRLDLVAVDDRAATLTVARGTGNRGFAAIQTTEIGYGARDLVVADLDGDDVLDVATANQFSDDVSILHGIGGGAFVEVARVPVVEGPLALGAADLDGDHVLDLAVLQSTPRHVGIYLGNGDGTFRAGQVLTMSGTGTSRNLVIADLSGDGRPDLLCGTGVYFLGNGDGTFGTVRSTALTSAVSAAAGDLNRDGRMDIVLADFARLVVQLGTGGGNFGPSRPLAFDRFAAHVAIADVHGFGFLDILVADGGGDVLVYTGDGAGNFPFAEPFPAGSSPDWVEAADVDSDGRVDLVTANAFGGTASVLWGNPLPFAGSFDVADRFPAGESALDVAAADFDGDDRPDLAVTSYRTGEVAILRGFGGGTFGSERRFAAGESPIALEVADVDRDGEPDIAVLDYALNDISVLKGVGNGTFLAPQVVTNGAGATAFVLGDLDGNGAVDVVTVSAFDEQARVLLGNGDGTFQPELPFLVAGAANQVAIGDLNGDPALDLVMVQGDSGALVFLGNGDGTFQAPRPLQLPGNGPIGQVSITDLDGADGLDIVITRGRQRSESIVAATASASFDGNEPQNGVIVLLGTGDGTFSPARIFAAGPASQRFVVADLDFDGRKDVAVTDDFGYVAVLLATGSGDFQPPRLHGTGRGPSGIALVDANGDQLPDLVTADSFEGMVTVLLHQ
ncbi:MAG TPA: FG-GAP-like repeat-containing protein [Candidatus Binatia bacterium]|jgi:hypothetical protein|nr:FG-GAP-like repeat-containing protein [Candidatus Binatia bacterium]